HSPGFSVVASFATGPQRAMNALGFEKVKLPSRKDVLETTLHPGDVLYLPAGTWHRAFANKRSFAVSTAIHPVTPMMLIHIQLIRSLLRMPDMRADLTAGDGDLAACIARVQKAAAAMTPETLRESFEEARRHPGPWALCQD